MHDNIDPNTKAFGFVNKDAEDLYKAVLVITDENFQNDLVNLMLPQTTGEARAHASGRVSAFNDILRLFQANRDYMLKATAREKQSNPSQSVSQP
jgi:hypothetical protein